MKLFAGIALDRDTQVALGKYAAVLRTAGLTGRYVSEDKYHLTLAYLGPVDAALLEPVQGALREAALTNDPFTLVLDRIGAFPDARRPRVVWAGCAQPSAAFDRLCSDVRRALAPVGFTFAEEGIAHATLARTSSAQPLPSIGALPPVVVDVRAITLFDSVRVKQTTRYERVVTMPLRGAGG